MKLFLTLVIAMLVMAATGVSAADSPAPGPSSDATTLSSAFASLFVLAFALLFWFSYNSYMCEVEVVVFGLFFSFFQLCYSLLTKAFCFLGMHFWFGVREKRRLHNTLFACFFLYYSYSYVTNSLFLTVLLMGCDNVILLWFVWFPSFDSLLCPSLEVLFSVGNCDLWSNHYSFQLDVVFTV